jgi:hypothetical protein
MQFRKFGFFALVAVALVGCGTGCESVAKPKCKSGQSTECQRLSKPC